MNIICWGCILINIIGGIALIASETNKRQDAAGKNLMSMIGIILILFAGAGALLLFFKLPYISMAVMLLPTFIVCRQVIKLIREY